MIFQQTIKSTPELSEADLHLKCTSPVTNHTDQLQFIKRTKNDINTLNKKNSYQYSQILFSVEGFQKNIADLNKTLQDIHIVQIEMQKEFNEFSQLLHKKMADLEKSNHKIYDACESTNSARLEVISEQKKALFAYKMKHIDQLIKDFFRPLIGVLYHHPPRAISIPKSYNKTPNLKDLPTLSIVTPSFNQGAFLEDTIFSIIGQKYPKIEYVIQDGGSTDETVDIIKRYESVLKHWESKKDNGQSNALNLGFQHTTGEIMAYLNSDDILLPGCLHYIVNYFNEHPEVDVVYGHRVLIDEYNQEVGRWILPQHDSEVLKWADYIPQETLFWRRSIWKTAGAHIDENFKFAMDWELLLRFQNAGAKFVRLPRFLGAFRIHPHQKTSAQIKETGIKEMNLLRTRCHGRNVSWLEIKKNMLGYMAKHILLHKLYRLGILRY